MPKKIRELKAILLKIGFTLQKSRGKGSHSVWQHPLLPGIITIAGKDGSDARPYLEKVVRDTVKELEDMEGDIK